MNAETILAYVHDKLPQRPVLFLMHPDTLEHLRQHLWDKDTSYAPILEPMLPYKSRYWLYGVEVHFKEELPPGVVVALTMDDITLHANDGTQRA